MAPSLPNLFSHLASLLFSLINRVRCVCVCVNLVHRSSCSGYCKQSRERSMARDKPWVYSDPQRYLGEILGVLTYWYEAVTVAVWNPYWTDSLYLPGSFAWGAGKSLYQGSKSTTFSLGLVHLKQMGYFQDGYWNGCCCHKRQHVLHWFQIVFSWGFQFWPRKHITSTGCVWKQLTILSCLWLPNVCMCVIHTF